MGGAYASCHALNTALARHLPRHLLIYTLLRPETDPAVGMPSPRPGAWFLGSWFCNQNPAVGQEAQSRAPRYRENLRTRSQRPAPCGQPSLRRPADRDRPAASLLLTGRPEPALRDVLKGHHSSCCLHACLTQEGAAKTQPPPVTQTPPTAPHWPRGLKTWQEGSPWAGFTDKTAEPGSESRGRSPHHPQQ